MPRRLNRFDARGNDRDLLAKRIDQRTHSIAQRLEDRLARRLALLPQRSHHDASEPLLVLDELRQNAHRAEIVGRTAVDAREQRLGKIIHRLAPKMIGDELGDGAIRQGFGLRKISVPMRNFVPQVNSSVFRSGMRRVGTTSWRPSGSVTKRPSRRT